MRNIVRAFGIVTPCIFKKVFTMTSVSLYPTVIASERWRDSDLRTLEAITDVVYRDRLGRVDFLLGPGQAVIVDGGTCRENREHGLLEHLAKLHRKSCARQGGSSLRHVIVISAAPSVDLQLLCHRLGFNVLCSFEQATSDILVHLLKMLCSNSNNFFPKITAS
ncbi:uncharacterized protein LOC111263598 isoform X2 [Varroa jacobsoni]|uniref:Uncharacterized protein n=2 Tax=Varroa TaxID=62624 RepID=A0A7M7K499_VARDE|nr:uncharacterized protein LOC111250432 isoform X1 [Varroa destructor]XP_022694546.1 uncharacterized protein LOC111263598 isoform X2 [Varroa jacobsoni]